jgi:hypothetical protein
MRRWFAASGCGVPVFSDNKEKETDELESVLAPLNRLIKEKYTMEE